jgi:hypothetical protein
MRQQQVAADKAGNVAQRQRELLSSAFIDAYQTEVLAQFNPQTLLDELPATAQVIALFCVERSASACHRSLVANYLSQSLGWNVEHIEP